MAENYCIPPRFQVENLIAENDYVTAVGTIRLADNSGDLMQYEYCNVWRFCDGKMAELKAFVIASNND